MSDTYGTIARQRRLPVFLTLRRAAQLMWIHRKLQFHLAVPPVLLLAAVAALATDKLAGAKPEQVADILKGIPAGHWLPWIAAGLAGIVLLLMFSVSWRRYLLLDIPPAAVIVARPFRRYLVMFVIAYFGVTFAGMILMNILLGLLQLGSGKDAFALPVISALCMLLSMVTAMFLVVRYILLFTASTVENYTMTFREAGAFMKGNVLRYGTTWALAILGVNFLNNVLSEIDGALFAPGNLFGSIVMGLITAATMFASCSLTSSIAALAYDFLVNGGGPDSTR